MKQFYLITNHIKDSQGKYTERIISYIEKNGGTVITDIAQSDKADCVLVLGGDGTMLQAARDMLGMEIPLLGINLGTLGYLAGVEISNIEECLMQLLQERYIIEERMMLAGFVSRNGAEATEERDYALNDVVISRCGPMQILTFEIYVNGRYLNTYSADGIILATPTGSTGYNLSAGGPIVEPSAKLLMLTPICPHTLNTRSIILAPEDEIRIEIPLGRDKNEQVMEAVFDGSHRVTIRSGDAITVQKSTKTTKILKLNSESFLTVLHKKISE